MASVQFHLDMRGKGGKGDRTIILRFTHQYKSFKNAKLVGLRVPVSHWDFDAKGSPESVVGKEQWAIEARARLAELQFRLVHKIPLMLRDELGRDATLDEIKNRILEEENLKDRVGGRRAAKMLGTWEEYIAHCRMRDQSPMTIRAKGTFYHRFSEFCQTKGIDPYFDDVTLVMYDELVWHLRHEYRLSTNETVVGLSDRSIGTAIKDWKAYMNWALSAGYSKNEVHKHPDFKKLNAESDSAALSLEEIWAIIHLELPDRIHDRSAMETARDVMIVGMMTGLRVSDLLTMERHEVNLDHKHPANSFIRLRTSKGSKKVEIPIHPEVFKVFSKYKHQPDFALPQRVPGGVILTEQFFNRLIKEVAKQTGITEQEETRIVLGAGKHDRVKIVPRYTRFSAHSLRRTFITRLHAAGVSEVIVRRLSGHSTLNKEAHHAYIITSTKEDYEIVVRAFRQI